MKNACVSPKTVIVYKFNGNNHLLCVTKTTSFNMSFFPLKKVFIKKVMQHIQCISPQRSKYQFIIYFYIKFNLFISQTPTLIFSLNIC